ncbi:MAG: DsrE/DsrF/DrsH-like family protein [Methanobacterium sp.]
MVEKATIIVHSGDMDKLYSAFIIANGALSMGMEASLYFTFWGLQVLLKDGLEKSSQSKMGMDLEMMLKKANVVSLEKLIKDFKELDGKIIACEMTMDVMGIKKEDLREDLIDEYGAVGTYINEARNSQITLFI